MSVDSCSRFFKTSRKTISTSIRISWKGFTSSSQFSIETPSPKPTHFTLWSRNHHADSALINSLLSSAVGSRGEGREFPVAVQNDNVAFLNTIAAGTIQISSADVGVGLQEIDIYINSAAHEGGQRKISNRFSVFKMVIRTLAVVPRWLVRSRAVW